MRILGIMKFFILTLFPEMFAGPLDLSIIKRAKETSKIEIHIINIRDFSSDAYKSVDDHPYGGGQGMILRVDVVDRALRSIPIKTYKILLDPAGKTYSQHKAVELSKQEAITLVCGHYEGVDERIRSLVDEELSVGDYILTGGEIPAMVVIDSVARLLTGVLKKLRATTDESFSGLDMRLEYPQYTRPLEYQGIMVPDVLTSGNHKKIDEWRENESKKRTAERRADLVKI